MLSHLSCTSKHPAVIAAESTPRSPGGAQQEGVPVPKFSGEEGSSGTVRAAGPAVGMQQGGSRMSIMGRCSKMLSDFGAQEPGTASHTGSSILETVFSLGPHIIFVPRSV